MNTGKQHMVRKEGGDIEMEAEEIPPLARVAVNVHSVHGHGAESRITTHGSLLPRLPNSWPNRKQYQPASGRSTSVPATALPSL